MDDFIPDGPYRHFDTQPAQVPTSETIWKDNQNLYDRRGVGALPTLTNNFSFPPHDRPGSVCVHTATDSGQGAGDLCVCCRFGRT